MRCCIAVGLLLLTADAALAEEPVSWPPYLLRGANVTIRLTEPDVKHYAQDWQANSCRLLINDMLPSQPPYRPSDEVKKRVFDVLDLCLRYGLYTVFSPSASFDDNDKFFENSEFRKAYVEFWEEVARRYRDAGPDRLGPDERAPRQAGSHGVECFRQGTDRCHPPH